MSACKIRTQAISQTDHIKSSVALPHPGMCGAGGQLNNWQEVLCVYIHMLKWTISASCYRPHHRWCQFYCSSVEIVNCSVMLKYISISWQGWQLLALLVLLCNLYCIPVHYMPYPLQKGPPATHAHPTKVDCESSNIQAIFLVLQVTNGHFGKVGKHLM